MTPLPRDFESKTIVVLRERCQETEKNNVAGNHLADQILCRIYREMMTDPTLSHLHARMRQPGTGIPIRIHEFVGDQIREAMRNRSQNLPPDPKENPDEVLDQVLYQVIDAIIRRANMLFREWEGIIPPLTEVNGVFTAKDDRNLRIILEFSDPNLNPRKPVILPKSVATGDIQYLPTTA